MSTNARPYTHQPLGAVADSAPELGAGEIQETRFAAGDLDTKHVGFTHHRFRPGARQPFGHRHEAEGAEEVYVVISGSGRMKLDDEVIDLQPLDAVRVEPTVVRAFEAGRDGLEVLAFGPRHEGDGELVMDWWLD